MSGEAPERLFFLPIITCVEKWDKAGPRICGELLGFRRPHFQNNVTLGVRIFPCSRAAISLNMLWWRCIRPATTLYRRNVNTVLPRLARAQSTSTGDYETILVSNPKPGVGLSKAGTLPLQLIF